MELLAEQFDLDSAASTSMYRSLFASSSWVASSAREPSAIERKRTNSFKDERACPSAMFDGTETAARRI
jgi:hypothetical protein